VCAWDEVIKQKNAGKNADRQKKMETTEATDQNNNFYDGRFYVVLIADGFFLHTLSHSEKLWLYSQIDVLILILQFVFNFKKIKRFSILTKSSRHIKIKANFVFSVLLPQRMSGTLPVLVVFVGSG
jgi:hypothetical protein